jgi:peptide/nickel transport system permease protein
MVLLTGGQIRMNVNNVKAKISVILSATFLLFILASGIIFPDANMFDTKNRLAFPSLRHLFGTDQFGRDVFIRTMHGFRYTFTLALFVEAVSFPAGLLLGVILGYYGGILDEIIYQFSNLILSFPATIAAILIAALTNSNIWFLLLLINIYAIISYAKIVRGEVKVIKNADYIRTLRILGASDFRIVTKHLLRKSLRMLLPSLALLLGHVIISISTYSFMGFGVRPPQPEIGAMLQESLRFTGNAPWLMILPGLFQFFMVLLILNLANNIKKLVLDKGR